MDIDHYLTDADLKGILTPQEEKAANKSRDELLSDYQRLYKLNQKQMELFLKELNMSQQKTEILLNVNSCIHKYNKENF